MIPIRVSHNITSKTIQKSTKNKNPQKSKLQHNLLKIKNNFKSLGQKSQIPASHFLGFSPAVNLPRKQEHAEKNCKESRVLIRQNHLQMESILHQKTVKESKKETLFPWRGLGFKGQN